MPGSNFKISDMAVKDSVANTVHLWNKGFQNIKGLAQGDDWSIFFKVKDVGLVLLLFIFVNSVTSFPILIKFIMFSFKYMRSALSV